MSAVPPDAEEEYFGNSSAIPSGGRWIGSVEGAGRTTGGEKAKRQQQEGNSEKAREWVALCGPGPSSFKEDRTDVHATATPKIARLSRNCPSRTRQGAGPQW